MTLLGKKRCEFGRGIVGKSVRGHWALALVFLGAPLAAIAQDAYVTVASGTSQTLALQQNGSYQARIAVAARQGGPAFATLELTRFDVQYKELRSTALLSAFTATKEAATATQDDAIVITAAADLLPGSYVLTLHIVPPGSAQKPQSLVLTLSKPPPLVTAGASVYIERTKGLLGTDTLVPGRLRLTEDSHAAALPSATLAADIDHKPGAPAAAGELDFPPEPISLAPGKSDVYCIGLKGDFPPGTYTGKITVRSPYLNSPISVSFELLSRRTTAWLIVLAALGAALGLLVRVGLKNLLERDQALIGASLTLQTLLQARARIEEPDLNQRIVEEIRLLREEQQDSAPTAIATASTAAAAALQSIEQEFQQRRSAFAPKLDSLTELLAKRWILPPPTARALSEVSSKRDDAAAALARGNIAAADKVLQAAIRGPLLDAATTAMKWRASFAGYLDRLGAQNPPLDDGALQKLHAAVASAAAQVPADLHPTSIDVNSANAELTRTHGAFTGGQGFFADLSAALGDFLAKAQSALAHGIDPDDEDWKPIAMATRLLADNLRTALSTDLDEASSRLQDQSSALQTGWCALLKKRLPEAVFATVASSMSHGAWSTAIAQADAGFAAGAHPEAVAGAPERVELAGRLAALPGFALRLPNLAGFPELLGLPSRTAEFVLTGSAEERQRLRKRTVFAETAQTAIVAVLFVAGVYGLNADTWIGTSKEMVSIFMLAFGADLSAQGLLALLRK